METEGSVIADGFWLMALRTLPIVKGQLPSLSTPPNFLFSADTTYGHRMQHLNQVG